MTALAEARPVALFQGCDSITGSGRQSAVTGASEAREAESTSKVSVCRTATELANSLQIDASLSVSYAGLGSADAKMSFFSSLNVTTHSISVVVYARKVVGRTERTNATLKEGIVIPADADQLADFVTTYGDSFLSSITMGGEFYAVYMFYSETDEEQRKVEADLKASGIVAGVSVSADLSAKMSNFSKTSTTRSYYDHRISGIKSPPPVDAANMAAFASTFPGMDLDNPAVIAMATAGYEELPGFRRHFAPIIKARRYFTDKDGIVDKLAQLKQIDNQATSIKRIYDFYGGHQDRTLEQNQRAVRADIKAIKDQLDAYSDDPTQPFNEPALPSLANGSPSLNFEAGVLLYGNTRGTAVDDVGDVAAYLRRRTRISKLYLRTGEWIDHMETTYSDEAGTRTTTHGGDDGSNESQHSLVEDEFFVECSGKLADSGNVVNQITLTTNKGQTVSGGYTGDIPFANQLKPDQFILGFSVYVLDDGCRSLGVQWAHLLDAKWHAID